MSVSKVALVRNPLAVLCQLLSDQPHRLRLDIVQRLIQVECAFKGVQLLDACFALGAGHCQAPQPTVFRQYSI